MREPRVFEDLRYLVADEHVEDLRRDAAERRRADAIRRAADDERAARAAGAGRTRALRNAQAGRGSLAACAEDCEGQVGVPA
jgi:hypothetical protein